MTTKILNLKDVELTKKDEAAAAALVANYEVLQKNIAAQSKDALVKALAYEVRGRKRMQVAQRLGARIGTKIREEIEAEIVAALGGK